MCLLRSNECFLGVSYAVKFYSVSTHRWVITSWKGREYQTCFGCCGFVTAMCVHLFLKSKCTWYIRFSFVCFLLQLRSKRSYIDLNNELVLISVKLTLAKGERRYLTASKHLQYLRCLGPRSQPLQVDPSIEF